jgi:hypothetical protein
MAIQKASTDLVLAFLFFGIAIGDLLQTIDAYRGDLLSTPKQVAWPHDGQKIEVRVIRDTGISSANGEEKGNNGGASKLKLKGIMEYILMDIDSEPLKNKIISGALLHIRSASPKDAPLARLGISSIASAWVEGSSSRYPPQIGSSCFLQAEFQRRDWAYSGSTLMDVVFGRGHTIW